MKTCSKCGVEKPDSEFNRNRVRWLRLDCKTCQAEHKKAWQEANRDEINEKERARYRANREKRRAQNSEYQRNHPEQRRAYVNKWARNNPEKVKAHDHNKRAKRLVGLNTSSHTAEDIQYIKMTQTFGDELKCCYCAETILNDNYHLDHIIPLARGGDNSSDNICIACPACNMSKGSKLLLVEWNGR